MGMDQDDILLAPWTTIKRRVAGTNLTSVNQSAAGSSGTSSVNTLSDLYPGKESLYSVPSQSELANTPTLVRFTNVDQIMVAATSPNELEQAMGQITRLLRERHRIDQGELSDFNIRDMTEMIKIFSSTTSRITNLLLCVAFISLIVGGVGIMNIMMVSVTERTREIGLRMAVGAGLAIFSANSWWRPWFCACSAGSSASWWGGAVAAGSQVHAMADGAVDRGHHRVGGGLGHRGRDLRLLSRLEGLTAGSDRGAEVTSDVVRLALRERHAISMRRAVNYSAEALHQHSRDGPWLQRLPRDIERLLP